MCALLMGYPYKRLRYCRVSSLHPPLNSTPKPLNSTPPSLATNEAFGPENLVFISATESTHSPQTAGANSYKYLSGCVIVSPCESFSVRPLVVFARSLNQMNFKETKIVKAKLRQAICQFWAGEW